MNKFFELVQIALGEKEHFDEVPTEEEWSEMFKETQRQALTGVTFMGLERLPEDQRPTKALILQWYTIVARLEDMNRHLNKRSFQVQQRFLQDGFLGCILKGQGNAMMYPNPLRRQCGDIDIWLLPKDQLGNNDFTWEKNREIISEYVIRILQKQGNVPDRSIKYHHIEFPVLKDVEVEVHFFPMFMQNHWNIQNLLKFFKITKDEVFSNYVELPEGAGKICMPTAKFNAVYQLTHIFVHFIIEGIGLRHFVDYYYVMKNLKEEDKPFVVKHLKKISLYGFSKSVMYVLKESLGLEDKYLISEPDEKRGKVLISEILAGGNFGHYETRYWKSDGGFVNKNWQKIKRNAHFTFSYPSELLSEPVFRMYHYWWGKRFQHKIIKKIEAKRIKD